MRFPVLPKAPDDVIAQRLATCRACEFRGEVPMVKTEVCELCHCPLITKSMLQQPTCPKSKW